MFTTTYTYLMDEAAKAVGMTVSQVGSQVSDSHELSRLQGWPNRAVDRVARAAEWPWFRKYAVLTCTADTAYVLLPSDFQSFWRGSELAYVSPAGQGTVCFVGAGEVQQLRASATSGGYPAVAAIGEVDSTTSKLKLELYPTPGGAYTLGIFYRRQPTSMTSGSDPPDLPNELHDAVVVASRIVAQEELNGRAAQEDYAIYAQSIQEAMRTILAPQSHHSAALRALFDRAGMSYQVGETITMVSGFEADL